MLLGPCMMFYHRSIYVRYVATSTTFRMRMAVGALIPWARAPCLARA
uniref:Uncharacterized protein n=1 Tax=Arundo donax TaxID=35708 RepID=A0A0A9B2T8_ARUDO